MARKTQRPDDIVWTVTSQQVVLARCKMNSAIVEGQQGYQYEGHRGQDIPRSVPLGVLLDTIYPRKAMVKLFDEKLIHVDGCKATSKMDVVAGSEIWIAMAKEKIDYTPEAMDLRILYEDDDLLIVDKPAGLTVNSPNQVSLANGVAYYFKEHGIKRKVRFLNRLDRDTTGCIVIAKSGLAQSLYQQQMDDNRFEKWYTAVVEGLLPSQEGLISEREGTLVFPMRRSDDGIHYEVHELGVMTKTEYRVIKNFVKKHESNACSEDIYAQSPVDNIVNNNGSGVDNVDKLVDNLMRSVGNTHKEVENSLIAQNTDVLKMQVNTGVSGYTEVEVRLWTGKTHQIRVAFSHCGHPLVGDALYGGQPTGNPFVLRATKIVFDHIRTGKRITVCS